MMTLNIHHFMARSSVNGPGERAVVWTQGCPLHCEGCFNPETHNVTGGQKCSTKELADKINAIQNIRGLTISGGEPLIQTEALIDLLQQIRSDLDILLFSGYTLSEIEQDPAKKQVLKHIDAALLGRYDNNQPHPFYGKKLITRGSRIQPDELKPYFKTELIINNNTITATGLFKKGA